MSFSRKIRFCSVFAVMILQQASLCMALTTVPNPTEGEWCRDSWAAIKYAEENGLPVIAVCGGVACGFCAAYDKALSEQAFVAWRKSTPYIYIHVQGDTTTKFYNKTYSFHDWMWGKIPGATSKLDSYPFVMFYWKRDGQVLVEKRHLGRTTGTLAIGHPLAARTQALAEQYFADYSPVPLPTDKWDTNDDTRAGTTNVVTLTGTPTAQGTHFLNMTDTEDWMKFTGSVINMTNYVWFTNVTTNDSVAQLRAEFYLGDNPTPVGILTNWQGTFQYQATTLDPLVMRVCRMADTNAVVKYTVNCRRDVPVSGSIGYTQVKFGATPPAAYTTAETTVFEGQPVTVWLSRVNGSDLAVNAMLDWSDTWPSLGPITWGHGVMGEKSLTFNIPEEAGYQAAARSLKLTIAMNAPAGTVPGKTILSLKIYDKDYASASISNLVTSGDAVLGQWYGYKTPVSGPADSFAMYTNLAARLNLPLVVYWGNEGCALCNTFVGQLNTPLVQTWLGNQKVLFLALKGEVSEDGYVGYNWIRSHLANPNASYPWVGFYWNNSPTGLVQRAASFSNATGQQFINTMTAWLDGYDNSGSLYTSEGGQFACGNTAFARLEAEPATVDVEVPFERVRGVQTPGTNYLVATFPDNAAATNQIVWAPGDTKQYSVVMAVNAHYALNQQVVLTLFTHEMAPVETNAITYVAAVPNSCLNPYFDKAPAVGEWTMDLEKATNATAQTIGDAYTLVLFSGTFWCPWCVGIEETVFATPEFQAFTQTHNVRLVTFDNPRRNTLPPTLLRHEIDSARTKFSGSAYLSRNGITVEQAEAKLIANSNQQYHAGWIFPGGTRIGYPTVLLLRKDGTIAGRVGFANNGITVTNPVTNVRSYPYDIAPAILRLNEALTLANDPQEERNGHWSWTTATLNKNGTHTAQLSASDKNDVYLLTGLGSGMRHLIQVTGPEAAGVSLSIQSATSETLVGPVAGNLAPGFVLTNSAPVADSYLIVSATGAEFAGTSPTSTLREYTVTSSFVLTPTEAEASLTVDAATQLQMDIHSNTVYRLDGTYTAHPADFEDLGNNLWRALRNGVTTLTFEGVVGEELFSWRIWNPGQVGFTVTAADIAETAGTYTITVERTGGTSGDVHAKLTLGAGTTSEAYRHGFPAGGIALYWADGQVGATNVTFAINDDIVFDGNQVIQVVLNILNPAPAPAIADGQGVLDITLLEDDQPVVGQLRFIPAEDQYFARAMTIVAVEGSVIPLAIERINGASTAVSATLTTTAGVLDQTVLNWVNKDLEPVKQVNLTVPALAVTRSFTVTFKPTGITAVSFKNRLTIQVVPAKPSFATLSKAFTASTYVTFRERIDVNPQGAGRITLAKTSGSLPYGLKITYDAVNKQVVLSGIPTRVGRYSCVYQLTERVGIASVKGGTLRLDFDIRALAASNPAAVARSYNFANYAVVDTNANKVTGLFNLTIGKTGRLSARYTHAGGRLSFSATGWSALQEDGTLLAVMQRGGYVVTIQFTPAGEIAALITEVATEREMLVDLVPAPWSAAAPADLYQGYYTVALSANTDEDGAEAFGNLNMMPLGHSYMTLSMNTYSARSGKMTYAGKLANGVSFSGSAVLLPYTGAQPSGQVHEYAQLGFFRKAGKEVLSGELVIQAKAATTYRDYPRVIYGGDVADVADVWWDHTEKIADLSYAWKYGVYGGYYRSADSLAEFYEGYGTTYGDKPMALVIRGDMLPASASYGEVTRHPGLYGLTLTANTMTLAAPVADGTSTTLRFVKATGVFSGTFRLNFTTRAGLSGRYQGVLLPGWSDCGCGGEPIKEMPFGLGATWFTDRAVFGPVSTYPIRGCPVEIFPSDL